MMHFSQELLGAFSLIFFVMKVRKTESLEKKFFSLNDPKLDFLKLLINLLINFTAFGL